MMAHEASEASTSPADILLRTITPLVLALAAGGLIIFLMGADPLTFFTEVIRLGTQGKGLQRVPELRRRSWWLERGEFGPAATAEKAMSLTVERLNLKRVATAPVP